MFYPKHYSQLVLASIAIASSWQANAEPTLYPLDLPSLANIQNKTNSNILADHNDPRSIWVLPPNTANATVSKLNSKTANMGYCAEMKDLQQYSRELSKEIRDLTKRKIEKQSDLDALKLRADKAEEESQKFAAQSSLEALADLDAQIKNTEDRLSILYKNSELCKSNCDQIDTEASDLQDYKKKLLVDRRALTKTSTATLAEYEKRNKVALAMQKTYRNAANSFADLRAQLTDVQSSFRKQFTSFGEMSGAKATFTYQSNWDNNVAQLKAENPGVNVSKVPTRDAVLMTEMSAIPDIDPTNSIKAFMVAGGTPNGPAKYTAYPESISASVVLSLIGACPMEHPEYFDLTENDVKDVQYGMIISYEYESVFDVKAEVSYNMYKLYQKIVSSGSKGGFFSSRSWSNVEEKNFFRDSFTVKWHDPENTIPEDKKDAMEQEMRRNVLLRLATLALPATSERGSLLAAAVPSKHGALVLADSLREACPTNVYCQGAAIVLNVLDAIFGSSSSSSSYTNITDVEVKENYQSLKKITKPWITSYLRKD